MGKNRILVEVDSPFRETNMASELINRLMQKNKIDLELSIAYDFNSTFAGLFQPLEHRKQSNFARIYINPNICKRIEDIQDENCEEPFCLGYSCDITMFGVIIHEFCHVLQLKVFPEIFEDFIKEFPVKRFYLNDYCNNELIDELAEIMTLYITNPYLLKLISIEHFNFCKKYFKSPTICNEARCFSVFKAFPKHVKKDLEKRWKIVFNYQEEKFQKVED